MGNWMNFGAKSSGIHQLQRDFNMIWPTKVDGEPCKIWLLDEVTCLIWFNRKMDTQPTETNKRRGLDSNSTISVSFTTSLHHKIWLRSCSLWATVQKHQFSKLGHLHSHSKHRRQSLATGSWTVHIPEVLWVSFYVSDMPEANAAGTIRQLLKTLSSAICQKWFSLKLVRWRQPSILWLIICLVLFISCSVGLTRRQKPKVGVYGWTLCQLCQHAWWLHRKNCIGVPAGLVRDELVCLCVWLMLDWIVVTWQQTSATTISDSVISRIHDGILK